MIATATELLVTTQNADGGWGGQARRSSTTEATCFAAMALGTVEGARLRSSVKRALDWLIARQHPDGSWPVNGHVAQGAWVTSLATLALTTLDAEPSRIGRGVTWLTGQEGRPPAWLVSIAYRVAPRLLGVQQNPHLKGWPWLSGTATFAEPTAYALLALKKARRHAGDPRVGQRIRQGELMLYDRMCEGGGWNYGNRRVLDTPLAPFADTTAVALIALQDHGTAAANQKSLQALRDLVARVDSGLALSWGAICFAIYGEDPSPLRRRLAQRYARTAFFGDVKSVALALLASGDGPAILRA